MKRNLIFLLCFLWSLIASAQNKLAIQIQGDFVSQYFWRGNDLGDFSFQPSAALNYKCFRFCIWATMGLSNHEDVKEFDMTASYTNGKIRVGLTDIYCNTNPNYFEYASNKTSHIYEGHVGYNFGLLTLDWFTNFAGADGVSKSGKRAYSSYLECNIPFSFQGMTWMGTLGMSPWATTYYAGVNGLGVNNLSLRATKDIDIPKNLKIPVFTQLQVSPCTGKTALIFGISVKP